MSDAQLSREDRVRNRAYRIWQEAGSPDGADLDHWAEAERQETLADEQADTASRDSFPASDPPAASGITGPTRSRAA